MSDDVKILSLNCRGLGDRNKRSDVFDFLKSKKYSIFCLQDIHSSENTEDTFRTEWEGKCIFSHKNTQSRGTGILFSKDLDYTIHDEKTDPNGNWVALDISLFQFKLTLISLYGPNEDNPAFYGRIHNILEDFGNPHNIICGDWNLTQDPTIDNYNYLHINNPNARQRVLNLKDNFDLIDYWRVQNPQTKRYTWRRTAPIKQARLDFFLISNELSSIVINSEILPGYRTDHSIITLDLNCCDLKRGKGYWKFNNLHLKDPNYIQIVKDKIKEVKERYAAIPYNLDVIEQIPIEDIMFQIDDQLFFEVLMMEIRGITISYSSRKKGRENF